MGIFFSSDSHWGHNSIIKYAGRPFKTVEEMDDILIENWNKKIGPKDTIYHLGDFCFFNKREDILKLRRKLKGNQIHLISGNHDGNIGSPENFGFASKHQLLEIKVGGCYITLCHFAMRVWPRSHYDSFHLYGHSHGCLPPEGKSWDVGVDANNFTPLEFEEVKTIMESRPHNLNWLKRLAGYNQKEYEDYRSTEMS